MTKFSKRTTIHTLAWLALSAPALAHQNVVSGSIAGTSAAITVPPTVTSLVVAITLDGISSLTSGNPAAAAEAQQIIVESMEDVAVYQAEGRIGGVLPAAIARLRELMPEKASATDEEMVQFLLSLVRTSE
ncbi:hypothetical protein EBZ37_04960 [bacterium]|nr:hypothetical protein [bacterium]